VSAVVEEPHRLADLGEGQYLRVTKGDAVKGGVRSRATTI